MRSTPSQACPEDGGHRDDQSDEQARGNEQADRIVEIADPDVQRARSALP